MDCESRKEGITEVRLALVNKERDRFHGLVLYPTGASKQYYRIGVFSTDGKIPEEWNEETVEVI
jgi:hypothetical protein